MNAQRMLRPALAALALTLAAGAVTTASAASHDRDTFIREQDLDKDGKVSKEDFAKGRLAEFNRMDADHDGSLSEKEYIDDYRPRLEATLPAIPADKREEERQRQMRQAGVRFGVLDSDKSGRITKPEFDYAGWGMFMHHETNGDGFVSKADVPKKEDDE